MARDSGRRQPVTDVVVLLPGILGSELTREGEKVWSSSRSSLFSNLLRGGGPVYELELDPDCFDDKEANDGVTAASLIPDTHMIPGLWTIDGYSKLGNAIKKLPGVTEGENYFEFPYDWRLDNRVAARRLAKDTRDWLDGWKSRNPDPKLVLIAHSMGGLVSRYFLEVLGGWSKARALITIGTPFQGSLQALDFMSNGVKLGPLPLRKLTEVARSLPSVYQLLPTYKCWAVEKGDFLELSDLDDIPNVDKARLVKGREFHQEIADAARDNAKREEYHATAYTTEPVAGVNQPTLQSAMLDGSVVKVMKGYRDLNRDGDGRVMRELATPDEKVRPWSINQRHAALQNDDGVITQIGSILSEPTTALRVRADVQRRFDFGVDVEEVHSTGASIPVHVTPHEDLPPLRARLQDLDTRERLADEPLRPGDDGTLHARLPSLPTGIYRLTVGGDTVAPVEDVICVARNE